MPHSYHILHRCIIINSIHIIQILSKKIVSVLPSFSRRFTWWRIQRFKLNQLFILNEIKKKILHILFWPCSCYWVNVYRKRKLKLRVSNQIVASKCCLYWGALLTVTEIKHLNWNTIHNMRGGQGKWNTIPIEYCDWGMVWKFMGKWVQGRSDYNNKIEENFNSINYTLCLSKFLVRPNCVNIP